MSETDKALMLLVGFFLCGIIAFSAGYVTATGKFREQSITYQRERAKYQETVSNLESQNRDLVNRQSAALGIITRTTENLTTIDNGLDDIEGFADAIIDAVGSLKAAWRLLVEVE